MIIVLLLFADSLSGEIGSERTRRGRADGMRIFFGGGIVFLFGEGHGSLI